MRWRIFPSKMTPLATIKEVMDNLQNNRMIRAAMRIKAATILELLKEATKIKAVTIKEAMRNKAVMKIKEATILELLKEATKNKAMINKEAMKSKAMTNKEPTILELL